MTRSWKPSNPARSPNSRFITGITSAWHGSICAKDELPVAAARIERSIRGFAAHLGVSEKYHQTITIVWLRLVEAAMRQFPGGGTLEDFLRQHPELLDQNLPFQFYSRERLLSDGARSAWVEPDLKALP